MSTYMQTFSALANLVLLFLHKSQLISFYVSAEEKAAITSSSKSNEDTVKRKSEDAWDELDKQIWPLICFTVGAFVGASAASNMKFIALVIPIAIVIIMILEIFLQRISVFSHAVIFRNGGEEPKLDSLQLTQIYEHVNMDFEI